MARRSVLAAVVLAVSACGSPTAPRPVPSSTGPPTDLSGTIWSGYLRVTSCSSPSGCAGFVGALYAFFLSIDSGTLTATLESSTPDAYVVHMDGVVHDDGWVVFSGTSTDGKVEITQLRLHKDAAAGLTGTVNYVSRPYSESRALAAVIPSASLGRDVRQPGPGASLSLAGTWAGIGRTESCTGKPCGEFTWGVPPPRPFTITIAESGGRYTALLDSDIIAHTVARLDGTAQPDGSVKFTGPLDSDSTTVTGEYRRFTLRADPSAGLLGDFEFFQSAPVGLSTRIGTILSGSRVVTIRSPGNFHGTWRGEFVPRSCTGDCKPVTLGSPRSLNLALSQVGSTVEGSGMVPITGTASGNALTLQGERIVEPCLWDWEGSVVCTQRLLNFSGTLDPFGQIQGTMELFQEGWSGSLHYRYTVVADLRNLIKRLQ